MIKPKLVIPNKDFTLQIIFDNGKKSTVDVSFILNESGEVVEPLKEWNHFQRVSIIDGIITWETGYDISPDYLLDLAG